MTATPEQIALVMARRIAAEILVDRHSRMKASAMKRNLVRNIDEVRAGQLDQLPEVQAALAAITETTDRAAKLVHKYSEGDNILGIAAAAALWSGLHLKGSDNG